VVAGVLKNPRRAAHYRELENGALTAIARHVHIRGSGRQTARHLKIDLRFAHIEQRNRRAVDFHRSSGHAVRKRKSAGLLGRIGQVGSENTRQFAGRNAGSVAGSVGHQVNYSLRAGNSVGQEA